MFFIAIACFLLVLGLVLLGIYNGNDKPPQKDATAKSKLILKLIIPHRNLMMRQKNLKRKKLNQERKVICLIAYRGDE